jgi:arylsulfatase
MFDSCDQTALLRGTGPSTRDTWYYLTETEEIPGAVRYGKWKAIWNIREGWRGEADYVATVPELFDLWQDPQERYDILMTHWTEKTWQAGPMVTRALDLLGSYKKYPNRPLVSEALGAPAFYADDAVVQAQAQKLLHSIAANK